MKKAKDLLYQRFLESLPCFDLYEKVETPDGVRVIALIGDTSAGKSSLLNSMLGCKQDVGVSDTTIGVNVVKNDP